MKECNVCNKNFESGFFDNNICPNCICKLKCSCNRCLSLIDEFSLKNLDFCNKCNHYFVQDMSNKLECDFCNPNGNIWGKERTKIEIKNNKVIATAFSGIPMKQRYVATVINEDKINDKIAKNLGIYGFKRKNDKIWIVTVRIETNKSIIINKEFDKGKRDKCVVSSICSNSDDLHHSFLINGLTFEEVKNNIRKNRIR